MSFGRIGLVTFFTTGVTVWSTDGAIALNASLYLTGTTTSLTSGLPSRETWTHWPFDASAPAVRVVVARRSVVLHTPMTGFLPGVWRSARYLFGTCSAIVLTLNPVNVS